MYVRYKKNIQENDLPRKRVRKASKIAGSGRQDLEIRCPERGRKQFSLHYLLYHRCTDLEIRCPERGRKHAIIFAYNFFNIHLEIRCPERGRKQSIGKIRSRKNGLFGNKMPREGTETQLS